MKNSTFDKLTEELASRHETAMQALQDMNRKEEKNMKLSEMTTTNFADFINAAGDSIGNIMQNEQVSALFAPDENRSPIRWMANAAKVLCGPCRNDILNVLGAMFGKTAEEIGNQSFLVTLGQIRSVYADLKTADIPE